MCKLDVGNAEGLSTESAALTTGCISYREIQDVYRGATVSAYRRDRFCVDNPKRRDRFCVYNFHNPQLFGDNLPPLSLLQIGAFCCASWGWPLPALRDDELQTVVVLGQA
jgi:hypothetical protein